MVSVVAEEAARPLSSKTAMTRSHLKSQKKLGRILQLMSVGPRLGWG